MRSEALDHPVAGAAVAWMCFSVLPPGPHRSTAEPLVVRWMLPDLPFIRAAEIP